jgi:hypothetical protein
VCLRLGSASRLAGTLRVEARAGGQLVAHAHAEAPLSGESLVLPLSASRADEVWLQVEGATSIAEVLLAR